MYWQIAYMSTVVVSWLISISQLTRLPLAVRPLSILLALILLTELLSNYLVVQHQNNQWVYHVYNPIEYAFLAYLYSNSTDNDLIRKAIVGSAVGFALFCLLNILLWQPIDNPPTHAYRIEWLLVLLLVMNYLYELYRSNKLVIITKEPLLWISVGNFFFYAGTFFLMSLIDEVQKQDKPLARQLHHINTVLNVLMYGFWAVGFLCNRLFKTSH